MKIIIKNAEIEIDTHISSSSDLKCLKESFEHIRKLALAEIELLRVCGDIKPDPKAVLRLITAIPCCMNGCKGHSWYKD